MKVKKFCTICGEVYGNGRKKKCEVCETVLTKVRNSHTIGRTGDEDTGMLAFNDKEKYYYLASLKTKYGKLIERSSKMLQAETNYFKVNVVAAILVVIFALLGFFNKNFFMLMAFFWGMTISCLVLASFQGVNK